MRPNDGSKGMKYIMPDFDTFCDVPKNHTGMVSTIAIKPDPNEGIVIEEERGECILHTPNEVSPGMKINIERYGRAIITEVAHASIFPVIKVVLASGEHKMMALQYTRFSIIY